MTLEARGSGAHTGYRHAGCLARQLPSAPHSSRPASRRRHAPQVLGANATLVLDRSGARVGAPLRRGESALLAEGYAVALQDGASGEPLAGTLCAIVSGAPSVPEQRSAAAAAGGYDDSLLPSAADRRADGQPDCGADGSEAKRRRLHGSQIGGSSAGGSTATLCVGGGSVDGGGSNGGGAGLSEPAGAQGPAAGAAAASAAGAARQPVGVDAWVHEDVPIQLMAVRWGRSTDLCEPACMFGASLPCFESACASARGLPAPAAPRPGSGRPSAGAGSR